MVLRKTGDSSSGSDVISGSAGDDLSLECVADGGNPAPRLMWTLKGQQIRSQEEQEDSRMDNGRWRAVSRLRLPVNHEDNGAKLECSLHHDALDSEMKDEVGLNIFYPPKVSVRSSRDTLLSEGDSITLSCDVDSNPPASVSWRKLEKNLRYISSQSSFSINSATRTTAGSYQCVAENELGLSQPETVVLDVQCKSRKETLQLSDCLFIKTFPLQMLP